MSFDVKLTIFRDRERFLPHSASGDSNRASIGRNMATTMDVLAGLKREEDGSVSDEIRALRTVL